MKTAVKTSLIKIYIDLNMWNWWINKNEGFMVNWFLLKSCFFDGLWLNCYKIRWNRAINARNQLKTTGCGLKIKIFRIKRPWKARSGEFNPKIWRSGSQKHFVWSRARSRSRRFRRFLLKTRIFSHFFNFLFTGPSKLGHTQVTNLLLTQKKLKIKKRP